MNGIAVIPARGGSKRLPRKNLLHIAGRPMIERPINTALATGRVSEVIVSTDDDEIAGLATALGASVHGRRPSHLAGDEVPTAPVVAYEVELFTQREGRPDFVIVLYPTSVFVTSGDLEIMAARLERPHSPVKMVMSVTAYPAPIERAWTIDGDDIGLIADPSSRNRQSQDFPERYYDAGQAYVTTADTWKELDMGLSVSTALHVLPPWKSWDINTMIDFRMAEILLHQMENGR